MKRLKNLKKKIIIIATVMLLVLCSALPIFADGTEGGNWYMPNASITKPLNNAPYYAYYFIVEYVFEGETYTYETYHTSPYGNFSTTSYSIDFGSIDAENDIIRYYISDEAFKVFNTTSDTATVISNEDIKMKLVILDDTANNIASFKGWFETSFTEIIPPSISHSDISVSFIEILTSGISNLASGIGSGVNSFVGDLFLNASGNGLSTFGFVVAIFGGLALACGLTKLIFEWIRSIGN